MKRLLTVAIPSYNRAPILRVTLDALASVAVPSGYELEVIVVLNSCIDDSPSMLEEFASRLPLRAISEPRLGVNFARNAAIDAARGDYIVFTDDDTIPVAHWLEAYVEAFERMPDVDVFGGPIEPHFTSAPAAWLLEAMPEVAAAYGHLEARGRGDILGVNFYPFGANMAFPRRVLLEHPFNPSLGPKGKTRINGSETELIHKLFGMGRAGRWVEGARVKHCIQPKQMTTKFLRWYYTGQGAAMPAESPAGTAMLWGRPRWLWREVIDSEMRFRLGRIGGRPASWVRDLKRASVARGRLTRRGCRFI